MMKKNNRLFHETSPYLKQHACNPVAWYPWCDEAFAVAVERDCPVILSIGYSTCHWCHVMEHESFSHEPIALLMNDHFVSIKVDREERPDIDAIYMKAVQAMTGQGGWPLTVFLTPDRKPFFGGTYFPPVAKWGAPGFPDLLQSIAHAWQHQRAEILTSSEKIYLYLSDQLHPTEKKAISVDDVIHTHSRIVSSVDVDYGGLSGAPKFPMGHVFSFLLNIDHLNSRQDIQDAVNTSLTMMARGGIYDQLGGGFHRYSTDAYWQLPHFEKMLYDQALLVQVYLEAYQRFGTTGYADIARGVLDYVLCDMCSDLGGFYAAEDADSLDRADADVKREGAYYVWSSSQLRQILDEDEYHIVSRYFGVLPTGNVKQDPHGEFAGLNVLHCVVPLESIAQEKDCSCQEAALLLASAKTKLLQHRRQRARPHVDEKILLDWNAMMISALSQASRVLDEPRYAEAATKAMDFILNHMRDEHDLYHSYCEGRSPVKATLDDYVYCIDALHHLYEATFEVAYLSLSQQYVDELLARFLHEDGHVFYMTQHGQEDLLCRPLAWHDGAMPSGNAMAMRVLARSLRYRDHEDATAVLKAYFDHFGGMFLQQPLSYAGSLKAFLEWQGAPFDVVIAQDKHRNGLREALNIVYSYYNPNKVVILRPYDDDQLKQLQQAGTKVMLQPPQQEKLTVYICREGRCEAPITDVTELKSVLIR